MADEIFSYIDRIAERATALGGTALGTARMAARGSELPAFPDDLFQGEELIAVVVECWAQYANRLRAVIKQADDAGDVDTADLFRNDDKIRRRKEG